MMHLSNHSDTGYGFARLMLPIGVQNGKLAVKHYLVSDHKWLFPPNSSLFSEFYPQNINYMPVVKFIEGRDLEENISFLNRHY